MFYRLLAACLIMHAPLCAMKEPEEKSSDSDSAFPYVLEKTIDDIPVPSAMTANRIYANGEKIAFFAGPSHLRNIVQLYSLATHKADTVTFDLPEDASIDAVAISPSQTYVAAGMIGTGNVYVYSLLEKKSFILHGQTKYCLSIECDDATVASANRDGTLKLWDIATQKNTITLSSPGAYPYDTAFAPQKSLIASINVIEENLLNSISVYDTKSGKAIFSQPGFSFITYLIAFNKDANIIALGGAIDSPQLLPQGIITITDLRKPGKPLSTQLVRDNELSCLQMHPDGLSYLHSMKSVGGFMRNTFAITPISDDKPSASIVTTLNMKSFYLNDDATQLLASTPSTLKPLAFELWKARTSKAKEGMCLVS